jgi:hypothetical protein
MQKLLFLIAIVIAVGFIAYSTRPASATPAPVKHFQEDEMSELKSDGIRGKSLRWTFTDGPMAGTPFEHTFNEDGSIVWRAVGGPMKGSSAKEKEYAAVKIGEDVYAISYLGASGHTLTVVLNFKNKHMHGFASNDKTWFSMTGTFETVR